jgi:hypothetical protein
MTDYDSIVERWSRSLAKVSGRRSALKSLGALLVGAAAVPLLPVSRASAAVKENGDPGAMRLLAVLRDRRLPVRLLRRNRHRVPAGHRACDHHVGRHVPQRGRRQGLHRFVQ